MKMLKNMNDVNALMDAVANCKDPVILKSPDGKEEYNLKSALSLLIGVARLCEERGEEYEVFCKNRADEGNMLNFFHKLSQNQATAS